MKSRIPAWVRTLERVTVDGHGCWIFRGCHDRAGYGRVTVGVGIVNSTHRIVYEAFVGPIPDGLHIDHLCRVPACCNPLHLEAVTPGENTRRGCAPIVAKAIHRRKTHCVNGHFYDQANTYVVTDDGYRCRQCRLCHRLRERARKARNRAA